MHDSNNIIPKHDSNISSTIFLTTLLNIVKAMFISDVFSCHRKYLFFSVHTQDRQKLSAMAKIKKRTKKELTKELKKN